MPQYGIVIVGGGEAGVRAAFRLRELGYDGGIALLSDEHAFPYERPPLSKSDGAVRLIVPESAYAEARIALYRGCTVLRIDPARKEIETSSGTFSYDRLLLATGAAPRRLAAVEGGHYLRTDRDAAAILAGITPGGHLVIVGAGFIGLEVAATARARGARVTVLEQAPRILGRSVVAEIAQALHDRHVGEGVRIETGATCTPSSREVRLASGERLDADVVLIGIGSVPRTKLAEEAGLQVDNGILVDSHFRSSAPDIFAAGDCCSFRLNGRVVRFESWRVARDQAEQAAASMLDRAAEPQAVPYFWSDQYDLCLQVVGIPDPQRAGVSRVMENGALLVFQLDEGGRLAAVSGLGAGTSLSREIKIAERLIAQGARPDPDRLRDPAVSLKKLLSEKQEVPAGA